MAGSVNQVSLILFAMSLHFIYQSVSSNLAQSSYPSGSLACKTYNMTKMDCSNRNLPDVPVLDQNLTTSLDLSHNQLTNITNAPFQKLKVLLMLDLSHSEISQMSSTTFRGLRSLEILDLRMNKLINLPSNIFSDLCNLLLLNMNLNHFRSIPGQALASLHSLQFLSISNSNSDTHEITLEGFENMTNLNTLHLFVEEASLTSIGRNTLYPLRKLPLREFGFGWVWADVVSRDVFQPLNSNIKIMMTVFSALPAIPSLQYPCQHLILSADQSPPLVVNNSSLQILQKWNASLEKLVLRILVWQRVEDFTFIWMSNLHVLNLKDNKINYIAKDAFYGLNLLQQLILSENSLTYLPSDALEVFRKSGSLQYLDLSSNWIANLIDQSIFFTIPTTLSYFNLGIVDKAVFISTKWIGQLQNLKHLIVTCISYHCNILINPDRSLPSLQAIQINNVEMVKFDTPLCTLFPTLKVIGWSSFSDRMDYFPLLEAIQGCFNLKKLDLPGVLQNTNLVDFKNLNITMSKLETLTLARNKLLSVKLFFFISAPKLTHLDLAENSIKTIVIEIAYEYPDLTTLNIPDNELTSLSGLQHFTFLQNLKAGSNKITDIPTWLLSGTHTLQTLDLSNNPFQCTCKIEPFRQWISSDKKTWLQPGQYECATPDNFKGISIKQLSWIADPKQLST